MESREDKLVAVLQRLNAGEPIEQVKQDAEDVLNNLDPTELSVAEQQLIANGMQPEDLRGLCVVHMEMLQGELEQLRTAVGVGHPLHTLIAEHDHILRFLQELDRLNAEAQQWRALRGEGVTALRNLGDSLLAAEKHHQREEDVLFPELEATGITGPPRVMRLEHEDLRAKKRQLRDLAEEASQLDLDSFKQELDQVAKDIVLNLRDHIFKENHILYPAALQSIESDRWGSIKTNCDAVGYCSFTPKGV